MKCECAITLLILCVGFYFMIFIYEIQVLDTDLIEIDTSFEFSGSIWDSYKAAGGKEIYSVSEIRYSLERDMLHIGVFVDSNPPDNLNYIDLDGKDVLYGEVIIKKHRDPVVELKSTAFRGGEMLINGEEKGKFHIFQDKKNLYGAEFKIDPLLATQRFFIGLDFEVGKISRNLEIILNSQIIGIKDFCNENPPYDVTVRLPRRYSDNRCFCLDSPGDCRCSEWEPSADYEHRYVLFRDCGDGRYSVRAKRTGNPYWSIILSVVSGSIVFLIGESRKSCNFYMWVKSLLSSCFSYIKLQTGALKQYLSSKFKIPKSPKNLF